MATASTTITEHEAREVERANESLRQPVVLVHGLWLLPSSWDRWTKLFDEAGYVSITPGWPAGCGTGTTMPGTDTPAGTVTEVDGAGGAAGSVR